MGIYTDSIVNKFKSNFIYLHIEMHTSCRVYHCTKSVFIIYYNALIVNFSHKLLAYKWVQYLTFYKKGDVECPYMIPKPYCI